VSDGGPINSNVIVIVESEEFLPSEEHAIVSDYGVWNSKSVYDVEKIPLCLWILLLL
jgi:hypothetical protein